MSSCLRHLNVLPVLPLPAFMKYMLYSMSSGTSSKILLSSYIRTNFIKISFWHISSNIHRDRFLDGGPRGRVGKGAVFQRSLSFDHLTAVSGVGSSPALATCETSQVLLACVSGGFPGVLPFRPTYRLARLYE